MKKRVLATLLIIALAATMAACGSSAAPAAPAASTAPAAAASNDAEKPAEVVELVIGGVTSQNAKDATTRFIELVGEYSGGSITCVDFPDNQLGNDEQRWEMTQTGECDISIGSTSSGGTVGKKPAAQKKLPTQKTVKVGRNDPCPCGSGLKYKKCCGRGL